MKKIDRITFVSVSFSILFTLLIFGCDGSEQYVEPASPEPIALIYPEIGEMHNQVLDSIFEDLQKAKLEQRTRSVPTTFTLQQALDVALESTISNLKEFNPHFPEKALQRSALKVMMYNAIVPTRSESEMLASMTPFQQKYFAKIQALCDEKGQTVADFHKQFLALQEEIKANAPENTTEADALYYGISVGYHSVSYWEQEWRRWSLLLGESAGVLTRSNGYPVPKNEILYPYSGNADEFPYYVPCLENPFYYYKLANCNGKYCVGYLFMCTPNTVWDQERQCCNWPDLVTAIVMKDIAGGVMGGTLASPGGAGAAAAGAISGAIVTSATEVIERFLDWLF